MLRIRTRGRGALRIGRWRVARGARAASWLLACVALACGTQVARPPVVVSDAAGLLSSEQRTTLAEKHELLLRDHDVDYRVDVATGAGDLVAYGVRRFRELDVGSRSESHRGLLLVLDPDQDRVRVEVGQNLEEVFPDAFVTYLETRQMAPFFNVGRLADGVLAATDLVVTRARNTEKNAAFEASAQTDAADRGAAAPAPAGIEADRNEDFRAGTEVFAGATPRETVHNYLSAMATRNGRPDLGLYSRETRQLLARRVMTPAQMNAVSSTYRACRAGAARVDAAGTRAVVRYGVHARQCAPWFLVHEEGAWRLDLAGAQQALRFGADNAWHFAPDVDHAYTFAFQDWGLDPNGYPHVP